MRDVYSEEIKLYSSAFVMCGKDCIKFCDEACRNGNTIRAEKKNIDRIKNSLGGPI